MKLVVLLSVLSAAVAQQGIGLERVPVQQEGQRETPLLLLILGEGRTPELYEGRVPEGLEKGRLPDMKEGQEQGRFPDVNEGLDQRAPGKYQGPAVGDRLMNGEVGLDQRAPSPGMDQELSSSLVRDQIGEEGVRDIEHGHGGGHGQHGGHEGHGQAGHEDHGQAGHEGHRQTGHEGHGQTGHGGQEHSNDEESMQGDGEGSCKTSADCPVAWPVCSEYGYCQRQGYKVGDTGFPYRR